MGRCSSPPVATMLPVVRHRGGRRRRRGLPSVAIIRRRLLAVKEDGSDAAHRHRPNGPTSPSARSRCRQWVSLPLSTGRRPNLEGARRISLLLLPWPSNLGH
ncbi:hypothetical protein ACLOJK_040631 [Asimina triloba]